MTTIQILNGILHLAESKALLSPINAVNRQARIDKLIYLARKAGKTESEISECLNDISTPLSVEQRLNKLIG